MTAPVPGPEPLHGYRLRDYDDLIATLGRSRETQGVTYAQLAAATGYTGQTIGFGLRGKHRIDGRLAIALADALGYDLALIPRDTEETP